MASSNHLTTVLDLMCLAADYPKVRIGRIIYMEEGTDFEEEYYGKCHITNVPSRLLQLEVQNFMFDNGVLEIRI